MDDDSQSEPEDQMTKSDGRRLRLLRPGEIFGNYRVVRCLCDGLLTGYYHMQHIRDLQDVTIGIFHHRASKDPKFLSRLSDLQRRLDTFDHEGIPKIRDCLEIEGLTCMRLDAVQGQTLSSYFAANGVPGEVGLGEDMTARILAQILGLVGYAHSQGLDHRDIDSDMVFIGEDGSITLLGLGVKATLGIELFESVVSASVSPLTSQRLVGRLDSFDVMSPEYRSGALEDSRVDVYCAAVIGYWLLTGRKPVLARYEPPSSRVVGLPRMWDDYFEKSLERKADRRYQSCRAALMALKDTEEVQDSDRSGFIQRQIDRIPVPKQIRERGQLATRIYRLSIIGLVGLTLAALTSFFVHVTFIEEREYSKTIAKRVTDDRMPHLRFKLSPEVSKVQFEGFKEHFISDGGLLELRIRPGDYVVKMSAPNHTDAIVRVHVAPGQDFTRELNVELDPQWGPFQIVTAPEATVTMIDAKGKSQQVGLTDVDGQITVEEGYPVGTYSIQIDKEGYASALLEGQVTKYGELSTFEVPIDPLPASLTVRTNPSGARISIGGIEVGESPITMEGVDAFLDYRLLAELPGYRSIEVDVNLAPGASEEVELAEFVPRSGSLQIEAEFKDVLGEDAAGLLEEVVLMVGERRYQYGDIGLNAVPEGDYMVRAEHPEYASSHIPVVLSDLDSKALKLTLLPKPGFVNMDLPTSGISEILLNGKSVSLDGSRLSLPSKERVEVEIRIPDYLTMMREFTLQPNETVDWKVEPVRIPGPAIGETWLLPYKKIELSWVPAGSFSMGSPMIEQGRLPDEGSRTQVTFTQGFWAGTYEITQAQYLAVVGENPSDFRGANLPVDSVLWKQARAFCSALTESEREAGRLPEGYIYRLPTEAEWEYAARAGVKAPYHFGETADPSKGNFRGVYPRDFESSVEVEDSHGSVPVGSFFPNAYGLFDVHGNVGEWTLDFYNGRLPGGLVTDPAPRRDGRRIALRGGTWEDSAVRVRSAAREGVGRDTQSNAIGFRVFLAPDR